MSGPQPESLVNHTALRAASAFVGDIAIPRRGGALRGSFDGLFFDMERPAPLPSLAAASSLELSVFHEAKNPMLSAPWTCAGRNLLTASPSHSFSGDLHG